MSNLAAIHVCLASFAYQSWQSWQIRVKLPTGRAPVVRGHRDLLCALDCQHRAPLETDGWFEHACEA